MADQVLIVSFQPFHIADFLICQISDSKKRIFPVHLFWYQEFSGATGMCVCSVYYQPRPQLAAFSGALGLAGLWAIPSTGPDPQPLLVTYNLSDPQDLDALLHIAAQRKIAAYQQQYADNQNISFLPGIVSTSTRIHGEFLRLLFLQAHLETEAHFTAIGMSSQHNNTEGLRFKCAAFYNGLKSKVGLAAAKAAALRVNLNVQGYCCGIVAPPMHAPSRTPLLLPLLLSHNLLTPRVH